MLQLQFATPVALEGVKSRRRKIFEVNGAQLPGDFVVQEANGLHLSLTSRVAAVGDAGRSVVSLLTGREQSTGSCVRHPGLEVVHLSPAILHSAGFEEAVNVELLKRPHVLVVDEALGQKNACWADMFESIINGSAIQDFKGAVVVCVADESRYIGHLCTESWVGTGRNAKNIRQVDYMRSVNSPWLCEDGERLMQEAMSIDYCNLNFWIKDAQAKGHEIDFFTVDSPDGGDRLRGFVCYQMKSKSAELHIRFIFVPKAHRASGYGGRIVRWLLGKASRMPESACRWISLETAHDYLIPWYEQFGFFDMTCGHVQGDYDQTWMEMQNCSMVVQGN